MKTPFYMPCLYLMVVTGIVLCMGCRSGYPGYVHNKTDQPITVTYKPYSFPFDSTQFRKGDAVVNKPDTVFHLSPRPVVGRIGQDGRKEVLTSYGFMEVVQVELKSGELVYIGELPTALDWEDLFRTAELSVSKGNESGTIKNPRTDFIRKKGIGVIYEIK